MQNIFIAPEQREVQAQINHQLRMEAARVSRVIAREKKNIRYEMAKKYFNGIVVIPGKG